MREKIFLLLLLLLLLGGVFWKIVPAVLSPIASDKLPDRLVEENGLLPEEQAPEFEPEMITVHLVGAVQNPGIYHLPEGSRVYELLEAGGGPSEEADLNSVNLARPLYDGEQVVIYRPGEAAADTTPSEKKVNINKASAEELMTLPSIGEAYGPNELSITVKNTAPLPTLQRSWMSAASARASSTRLKI